jgi:serine/threonine protein kinase
MEHLVSQQSYVSKLKQFDIPGLQTYSKIQITQKDKFFVLDRITNKPFTRVLPHFYKFQINPIQNPIPALIVAKNIARIIHQMHQKGFSYRVIKPENIAIFNEVINDQNVQLLSPSFHFE